jgi:hypothetical protein
MTKSLARSIPFMDEGHLAQNHSKLDTPFRWGRLQPRKHPRSDHLCSIEYVNTFHALLVDDSYLSEKEIAFILNIHQGIVKRILREELSF